MFNIGWEKSLIASVIANPNVMDEASQVRATDFTGCHADIWRVLLSLNTTGGIEYRNVVETLREQGLLDTLADTETPERGEPYLDVLMSYAGTRVKEYADQVMSQGIKKQLKEAGLLIHANAVNSEMTGDQVLAEAEKILISLRRNQELGTEQTLGDILTQLMPRIDAQLDGTWEPAFKPPIPELAELVDFVDHGEMVLIAARPGEAKSTILRYFAYKLITAQQPKAVTIINMDNNPIEYAIKIISLDTGLDSLLIRNVKNCTKEQVELVRSSARKMLSLPLKIITLGAASVTEVQRIFRRKSQEGECDVGMVDYIQQMSNGLVNKVQDVSMSSSGISAVRRELNIPMLCACQLSRAIELRNANAEPMLSDLRESGTLEQDPDTIWFPRAVWRNPTDDQLRRLPENVNEAGELRTKIRAIPIEIYQAKGRNTGTGKTRPFIWLRHTGDFRAQAMRGE